jgi:uncharacterized protein with HEPN domain
MPRTIPEACSYIVERIDEIRMFRSGLGPGGLSADKLRRRAIERSLSIICEAVRSIPANEREAHSDIPWQDIQDMGNVLRHRFERVDLKLINHTIHKNLAPLETAVLAISPIHIPPSGEGGTP